MFIFKHLLKCIEISINIQLWELHFRGPGVSCGLTVSYIFVIKRFSNLLLSLTSHMSSKNLGLKFFQFLTTYKIKNSGKRTNFLWSRTLAWDICATSTFTCITNTISTTIWWCWVITLSFTILNSTSTCLWTRRIWWPVSKFSINAY